MRGNTGIKKEIDVLRKALKEDEGYKASWIANLSMAFYDEAKQVCCPDCSFSTLKTISNKGAERFLSWLMN